MQYDIFPSPLGKLTVSTDGQFITGLHIQGDRYFTQIPEGWTRVKNHPLLGQLYVELEEYFAGWRTTFGTPMKTTGTPFQKQVWLALRQVKPGTTVTYGQLASQLGKPSAARAVGTAVGKNPICIMIPCHRVLGSGGKVGDYVAGPARKQQLLEIEGVRLKPAQPAAPNTQPHTMEFFADAE